MERHATWLISHHKLLKVWDSTGVARYIQCALARTMLSQSSSPVIQHLTTRVDVVTLHARKRQSDNPQEPQSCGTTCLYGLSDLLSVILVTAPASFRFRSGGDWVADEPPKSRSAQFKPGLLMAHNA